MSDDDDVLAAYDLSAWEVPAPAPGLIDAVIERARQPAPVAALDSGERIATPVRGKRRWWIAATAASVAVVAILIGVWGVQRTPEDGQGEVTATTARTLAIGPTTAALDPGALVRWRRDKRRISVAQPRGAAMWNVAADDTLVIDAGAMVATVEASGASLRVEVEMIKGPDARAIGISAATAVAVALVTIVVYEGTVRVRHDGQTVNVVPGAHYEVRPANGPEPISVGAAPVDPRIAELEAKVKQLEAERDALTKTVPSQDTCDEVSCVLTNYDGACCAKFKAQTPPKQPNVPETLNRASISEGMDAVNDDIRACATEGFVGTVKVKVTVAPDGRVTTASTSAGSTTVPAALASCVEDLVRTARFAKTVLGGSFGYPYVYSAADAACDADAFKQKADDHMKTGMAAHALAAFESSMRCRPDRSLYKQAFLASCMSKNQPKAKLYFAKLPAGDRSKLAETCTAHGIRLDGVPAPASAPCDADALRQKGDDHLATGMDAAALAAFEKSMTCRPDESLIKKSFLASCRSKNKAKAQLYFDKLPEQGRSTLAVICTRSGVQLKTETPAPAAACDAALLATQGDDSFQAGTDAAAFAIYEKSYLCKRDPLVARKAYMAACRSKREADARKYYKLVPLQQQSMLAQICIRQGIDPADPEPAVTTRSGVIKIASKPQAKIYLDGVDTGKTTPATLQATAGRHKITYELDDHDKFTFNVIVKSGETVSLTKELR